MGYLQGTGITQEQPHHWKAHLTQGMTPESLKLWSSFLSLLTTPQSEQICYHNLATQHLRLEHWSLHFILLGRNLKNLSRHCSLGHCGVCLLPVITSSLLASSSIQEQMLNLVEHARQCYIYTLSNHISPFFLPYLPFSLSPFSYIMEMKQVHRQLYMSIISMKGQQEHSQV